MAPEKGTASPWLTGGGHKLLSETDTSLLENLRSLVEPETVEGGITKIVDELGVPITVSLATRREQVEQNRASPHLVHHRQLARRTARQPQVIVQLIGASKTKTGLNVQCEPDQNIYSAGIKVSDADMDAVSLTRHNFHGEWTHTVTVGSTALALDR
jgi:hypothetical protein